MQSQPESGAGQYVGILLAAGKGARFDASGAQDKLLQVLPSGDTVIVAAAKNLLAVLPNVLAVVRPGADTLAAQLRAQGCTVSISPHAEQGMGASLAHAVSLVPEAAGWLIALADMPRVQASTIDALLQSLAGGADIAAPFYQGRRGNPVAFGRRHLSRLLRSTGDQGARALLQEFLVCEVVVDDAGVCLDIDTLADLSALYHRG